MIVLYMTPLSGSEISRFFDTGISTPIITWRFTLPFGKRWISMPPMVKLV